MLWRSSKKNNVVKPFFRHVQRIRQSRGYGVHSPFAFDLITNVIHSPYTFYAFDDIRKALTEYGFDSCAVTPFHFLSFRLVRYFNVKNILEINSGNGVNTLFLLAPAPDIQCSCIEGDAEVNAIAKNLREKIGIQGERTTLLPSPGKQSYDAIFINLKENTSITIETLMDLSHIGTFWVFHPIHGSWGKQFWQDFVHDERTRITFDAKETGIIFIRPGYNKLHYYV